jgi:predicted CXXCH cytochrome family protein
MATKTQHKKLKIRKRILPFQFFMFFFFFLLSCSATKNYKVLSFFFDGIPDPASVTASAANDSINKSDTIALTPILAVNTQPKMLLHSPYEDKQCSICHDQSTMGKLLKSQPELCYQCHEDFITSFKVLHGPVGGGQCNMCHSPHMSMNKHLLLRVGQSLCLLCHDQNQVMETAVHKDIKDAECTSCHSPHGGNDRRALR